MKPAPLHMHRLEVNNFMRVEAFSVDAEGKSIIIRAKNAEGKSSVIDAIWEVLEGSNVKERPEPVHEGAEKALLRIELADDDGVVQYIIEKHITPKSKRLLITAGDGTKHVGSAQHLLSGFLDSYSLDPVAFMERRPQDQLDDVLQVCGIQPPVQQVKLLAGDPQSAFLNAKPGESADAYLGRLSADDFGHYYRQRLTENQEVNRVRGAIDKQRQEVKRLQDLLANAPAQSIDEMQAALDAMRLSAKAYTASKSKMDMLKSDKENEEKSLAGANEKKRELENKKRQLELELEKVNLGLSDLSAYIDNFSHNANEYSGMYYQQQEAHARLKDPTAEIARLERSIREAVAGSKQVIERDHAVKRHGELEDELEVAAKRHAKTDILLNELRTLRKTILEGIDLGVPYLTVEDGELRLNGVSFRQASTAERIKVSAAVAMRRNPRLKLMRVDKGEQLDTESREYLLWLAAERGWQVIMACVADNVGLAVEIVDKE